jgi:predicted DNA-binding ribbon-helix-helix protein
MTKPALRSTGSSIKKRSILIWDSPTSISLEDKFYEALADIARLRQTTVADVVTLIEGEQREGNLSSAIRVFVLEYYRSRAAAPDALGAR